jgi:hypothetical protein
LYMCIIRNCFIKHNGNLCVYWLVVHGTSFIIR